MQHTYSTLLFLLMVCTSSLSCMQQSEIIRQYKNYYELNRTDPTFITMYIMANQKHVGALYNCAKEHMHVQMLHCCEKLFTDAALKADIQTLTILHDSFQQNETFPLIILDICLHNNIDSPSMTWALNQLRLDYAFVEEEIKAIQSIKKRSKWLCGYRSCFCFIALEGMWRWYFSKKSNPHHRVAWMYWAAYNNNSTIFAQAFMRELICNTPKAK